MFIMFYNIYFVTHPKLYLVFLFITLKKAVTSLLMSTDKIPLCLPTYYRGIKYSVVISLVHELFPNIFTSPGMLLCNKDESQTNNNKSMSEKREQIYEMHVGDPTRKSRVKTK
jgi:hypothetical protein